MNTIAETPNAGIRFDLLPCCPDLPVVNLANNVADASESVIAAASRFYSQLLKNSFNIIQITYELFDILQLSNGGPGKAVSLSKRLVVRIFDCFTKPEEIVVCQTASSN